MRQRLRACHWADLLATPNPAARAWTILRRHITQAATPAAASSGLREDVARLAADLGLTEQQIGTTTGMDPAAVRAALAHPRQPRGSA